MDTTDHVNAGLRRFLAEDADGSRREGAYSPECDAHVFPGSAWAPGTPPGRIRWIDRPPRVPPPAPPRRLTTIHLKLDIRGALLNWGDGDLWYAFRDDEGKPMSPRRAHEALLDRLAAGERYLPTGPCPGFDPLRGCPGHEVDEGGRS